MRTVLLLLLSILTVGCLTPRSTEDREPAAFAIVSERCGTCHGVTLGERCLAGPCANRAHAIEPRPWDLVLEWMEAVGCVLPAGEKAQLASYLLDRYPKTYPVRWEPLEPVPEGWNVVALASYRGGDYAGLEGAGKVYRLDGREWRTVLTTGAYTVYGLVPFGNRLVAGTNQSAAGIWSSDDGATWRRDAVLPAEERGVISLGRFRDELYAGTTRGRVYRSGDGVTWEPAGELLPGADNSFANWVRFLAAHRGVFYAGIESGGLFRSLDGRRRDAVTFREGGSVGVRASTVFGEHFYLGTTSGGEIWRTADGERWERVFGGAALPGRGYVASLGAAGGRLYAGINGRVYRSAEGTAWEEVGQLTPYTIEALHEFAGVLYAGTTLPIPRLGLSDPAVSDLPWCLGRRLVFAAIGVGVVGCVGVSDLEGPPPSSRSDLFVSQIALHPQRPQTVFALTTYAVGLLKSSNGGAYWSVANRGILSFSLYPLALDPRNPDVVYVGGGGGGLYKSTDGGATFSEMNDGLGNTNLGSITLHPADPDRLFVVTSSGVYISPDGGRTWTAWNQGDDFTQSQQFQDVVIIPTAPETVLLASNRGVFARRVGEASWRSASDDVAGRPITAMVRHPDGRRVFAAALRDGQTLEGGGLYMSGDAGISWTRWDRGLDREWIRAIRFDATRPGLVYTAASTSGVLRSTDDGRTWSRTGRGLEGQDIRALAIDPTDSTRLYAGTHGRGVFGSIDMGSRWTALDRVPDLRPETIIASLQARPSPSSAAVPPPAFAKCNACHGWTDPHLNQAAHSFWLVPPNRRDWGPTLARMGPIAGLTPVEQEEVRRFLTRYSEGE